MNSLVQIPPNRLSVWLLLSLFLTSLSAAMLCARGELSSADEVFVYRTAQAIVQKGSTEIDETAGRTTSRFSLLPSLWAAPFALAANLLPEMPERERWLLYFTCFASATATALAVILLAAWLARLGHSPRVVVASALLFAFGSLAFPYATSLYGQVLATPLLLAAAWSVSNGHSGNTLVFFGLLVFCRVDFALLVPAFALGGAARGRDWRSWLFPLAGATIGAVATLLVSWARGDPLLRGAYGGESFSTPFLVGLLNLLFSFGKGLAWYSPAAFAGGAAGFWYAARRPIPGRLVLYVLLTELVVISSWWTWHGGFAWGPRLLLPILPLCFLPLAQWLERWNQHSLLVRRAFGLLASASLAINLWAALQPVERDPAQVFAEIELIYVASASPLRAPPLPITPWLWNAPPSPLRTTMFVVLAIGLLGGLVGIARILASSIKVRPRALLSLTLAALFALAAKVPQGADFAPAGQYAGLESTGGAASGLLLAPITGTYVFHDDLLRPLAVQVAGRELFTGTRSASIELERGAVPITVRGKDGPPGTLRWTIPGYALFKEPVARAYLVSSPPTVAQSVLAIWIEFGWLLWLAALYFLSRWLLASDEADALVTHAPSPRGSHSPS